MFENQYDYLVTQIGNPLDDSFGTTDEDIEAYNKAYYEAVEMLAERTGVPCDKDHKYGLVVKFVFPKSRVDGICVTCDGFSELMDVIHELDATICHSNRMQCFRNMFINMRKVVRIETAVYLLDEKNGEDQMNTTLLNRAFGNTDSNGGNDPSLSYEMNRLRNISVMWWKKTNARPYTPEELERIEARKKATEEARNARAQRVLSSKCNPENYGSIMPMFDGTYGRKAEISPIATSGAGTIPDAVCVEDDEDEED